MKHFKHELSLKALFGDGWVDLGGGLRPKLIFFRIWSCCIIIKLKLMTLAATWYSAHRHTLDPGSESSHVAYQIKADDAGSNMVATILPIDTLLTQGVGSKDQIIYFSKSSHVRYQIKGNLAQSTMKANMLSLHTSTTPGVGSKGHFPFFSKCGHVAYQIEVEEV